MAWDSTKAANDLIASAEWNSMVSDQKSRALNSDLTSHTGSASIHINWTNATQDFLTTGTVTAERFVLPTDYDSHIEVPTNGDFLKVQGTNAKFNYTSGAGFTYETPIGNFHYFKVDGTNRLIVYNDSIDVSVPIYGTSAAPTINKQFTPKKYVDDEVGSKAETANAMGAIVHGGTAATSRPTGYHVITWIGSVEPTNATNNDIWINSA